MAKPYVRPSRRRGPLFLPRKVRGLTFQIFNEGSYPRLRDGKILPCSRCKEHRPEDIFSTFCDGCIREMNSFPFGRPPKKPEGYFDWERYICVSAADCWDAVAKNAGLAGTAFLNCGSIPEPPIPEPKPRTKAERRRCVDCNGLLRSTNCPSNPSKRCRPCSKAQIWKTRIKNKKKPAQPLLQPGLPSGDYSSDHAAAEREVVADFVRNLRVA